MYNHCFEMPDGKSVEFNAMTTGLAVIGPEYHKLMQLLDDIHSDADVPPDLTATYEAAKKGGFIVADTQNELDQFLSNRERFNQQAKVLSLTIAPTLDCNFKCVYCFETCRSGVMSERIMDCVIDAVSRCCESYKCLRVVWFGGEPLLAQSRLASLSDGLIKLCAEKGVRYEALMITNGSLITSDVAVKLQRMKISAVQVTLDGPKDVHNSRRVSKDGKDSFELIVRNIGILIEKGIAVTVRVNLDKANEHAVQDLIETLAQCNVLSRVSITFGKVVSFANVCASAAESCYSDNDFAEKLIAFQRVLAAYGVDDNKLFRLPVFRYVHCCAERHSAFVIDPNGYVYKCWNEIGDIERAIANVGNEGFDFSVAGVGVFSRSFPEESDCGTCKFLPVCAGGCMAISRDIHRQSCDPVRFNLRDIVIERYLRHIKQSKRTTEQER